MQASSPAEGAQPCFECCPNRAEVLSPTQAKWSQTGQGEDGKSLTSSREAALVAGMEVRPQWGTRIGLPPAASQ